MTPGQRQVAAALAAAREVLREAVSARRDAARSHDDARADLLRLAGAAAEGLEALAGSLADELDALPEPARATLEVATRGAWETLAAAGVELDGAVGESLDLERHRVVKRLGGAGSGPEVVAEVVLPGVLFKGTRVREAAVVAGRAGGADRD